MQGRQRGRRRVRDDRRDLHDVGHAQLGRRDAGADLQPAHRQGHRRQRARRRADRRHAGVLQEQGLRISAGVRPARGGHAGHARRHHGDARRVRQAQPRRSARAGDRDGGRLSDRSAGRGSRSSATRTSCASGRSRGARSWSTTGQGKRARAGGRRDLPAARSRRDAAQAGRGGSAGAEGRQESQAGDHGRVRPLLQRRHRARVRARLAGSRRAAHGRGSRELAASISKSR